MTAAGGAGAAPSASAGTIKPATQYGAYIENQGVAGMTTAVGIGIIIPTGATNNYAMEFNTADATAAGTYYRRVPVLVTGVGLRYLHLFNA